MKARQFKLFGQNVSIGKVENKKVKKTTSKDVLERIKQTQLLRSKEDVKDWRDALGIVESKLNPDRTDMTRIHNDIILDSHLSSLMQTLRLRVTGSPFFVENVSGEIDSELTERFKTRWFRDFLGHVVDARLFGASLVQFGDILGGEFQSVDLVPREYVIPDLRAVKSHLRITRTDLTYIDDVPFDRWTMLIRDPDNLGLLTKAAPLVLWKKNVLGAWAEAAELFGMPIRIGKTDINNPTAYDNMIKMLEEMGAAAYGVFDNEDSIDLVEITKSDYYNVYDRLIDRCNSEMSKLILGQTMSTDAGSSRSQAEVHERILDDVGNAFKTFTLDIVNNELFPLMQRHGILPMGVKMKHDNEEKIDIKTRFDMVDKLIRTNKYKLDPAYIDETFGIPVEAADELPSVKDNDVEDLDESGKVVNRVKSAMPSLSELYDGIKKCNH